MEWKSSLKVRVQLSLWDCSLGDSCTLTFPPPSQPNQNHQSWSLQMPMGYWAPWLGAAAGNVPQVSSEGTSQVTQCASWAHLPLHGFWGKADRGLHTERLPSGLESKWFALRQLSINSFPVLFFFLVWFINKWPKNKVAAPHLPSCRNFVPKECLVSEFWLIFPDLLTNIDPAKLGAATASQQSPVFI